MDELVYPCRECSRYTCRCPDDAAAGPQDSVESILDEELDWTPWSTGLAANA